MKYKLLKDLPTTKAGTIFEEVISDFYASKQLTRITPIGAKICPQFTIQDIDNFDEWFEKIEEPTTSVRRTPKMGEAYFYVDEYGNVEREIWDNDGVDNELLAMGFVRLTPEEAAEARDRRLAKVRLQRTSTFEPDFENGNGGWVVFYSYVDKELHSMRDSCTDSGELVRYETEEEAKRSIKENREDWLTYFGIKEEA